MSHPTTLSTAAREMQRVARVHVLTVFPDSIAAASRSIGDFYAHVHGVTWEPRLRVLEMDDLLAVRHPCYIKL